jgi:hypothetical protein
MQDTTTQSELPFTGRSDLSFTVLLGLAAIVAGMVLLVIGTRRQAS